MSRSIKSYMRKFIRMGRQKINMANYVTNAAFLRPYQGMGHGHPLGE